jgi:flagellar biosynthesis anti-sigma factor FlgM
VDQCGYWIKTPPLNVVIAVVKPVDFPTGNLAKDIDMVDAIISSQIPAHSGNAPTAAKTEKRAVAVVRSDIMPDTVQSASLPKLIRLAGDLANQGPPVDYARISEIRQAIALGTYRVDPERISDAMLRFGGRSDR